MPLPHKPLEELGHRSYWRSAELVPANVRDGHDDGKRDGPFELAKQPLDHIGEQ